jgi:hypothetical protein
MTLSKAPSEQSDDLNRMTPSKAPSKQNDIAKRRSKK